MTHGPAIIGQTFPTLPATQGTGGPAASPAAGWISLGVFVACYVLFVVWPHRRSYVACVGALLLVAAGVLGWREALVSKVNWNVLGLFFGTLVLAEIFSLSRVPAVVAEWLIDRCRTARGAMLTLCALAGGVSMFVENVAVVLLLAPVALSLAEKLRLQPVPLLIGIAVSSNLQGTATMIGDPPSMILAGYMRMGFLDFFAYEGRLGIFFAVEVGALASLVVLWVLFRRHRVPAEQPVKVERARSIVPTVLLVSLMAALSVATVFDREFRWFAGTAAMALAAAAVVWFRARARWVPLRRFVRGLDWDTTLFLAGVFVLAGALSDSGWPERLAEFIAQAVGAHLLLAFIVIVVLSVVVSGFVDNVPFLLAMIPVAQTVADRMGARGPLLLFGLLVGACLGGNLTPIGASANVVTIGLLKQKGHVVRFRRFLAIGLPFTAAAVLAASAFIWWVWA